MSKNQKVETPEVAETTDIVKADLDMGIVPVEVESLIERYKTIPMFIRQYGQRISQIERDYKTPDEILKFVEELSEDIPQKEGLLEMLQRLQPNRKGVISDRTQSFHTDLRIVSGSSADPNKPEDLSTGKLYYSSGDAVGPEFIGTPLYIWVGQELFEKGNPGELPKKLCTSQDCKVGNTFGVCMNCQYKPTWDPDGPKKNLYCQKFVNAFMLAQDGKEIAIVRFHKTSQKAGQQLLKLASRTSQFWSRWYSIKTAKQTHSTLPVTWYIYTVEVVPGKEGEVSKQLYPICDAFCTAAGREYIFPVFSRCYADALGGPASDEAVSPKNVTPEADKGFGYGAINEDIGEDA